ncbi:MAG TPA: hypothetical protein VMR54_11865 [Thermoanaerobaculia bacterium]|nr:hypothetical protein [Thermoanaerobaculia bacterium]
MRARKWLFLAALAGFGFTAVVGIAAPSPEAPKSVLATSDTNVAGLVAEFIECKVKEGVLSVKIRLRNTGNAKVNVAVVQDRAFDRCYVTAGSKKYFVLRDSEDVPLAPALNVFGKVETDIEKGGSWTWWAKYPAPPDSETKINYIWPLGAPFEDVPITR